MSSSPAPKRQRVDGLTFSVAKTIVADLFKADVVECYSNRETREKMLGCFRTHPTLLGETYPRERRQQVLPIEGLIRCGANLELVQELHMENPEALDNLMKNNPKALRECCEPLDPRPMTTMFGEPEPPGITAPVLEFLIKQYRKMAEKKVYGGLLLLEWLFQRTGLGFVTDEVLLAALKAYRAALWNSRDCIVGRAIQTRRSQRVIEAVVKAAIAYKKVDTVCLCPTSKHAVRKVDVPILAKLFLHLKKLTLALSFPGVHETGTVEFFNRLGSSQNSIKEIILEMPSRYRSTEEKMEALSKQLCNFFALKELQVQKLVIKSKRLEHYYGDHPYDNWMVELFAKAKRLPPCLTFLEFSNLELNESFDFSTWLKAPNLPSTVAFSGLKIKGASMEERQLTQSTVAHGSTIRNLEFFSDGSKACLGDMLSHISTATHLESLSLGFSSAVSVTETVRSLMTANNFERLELHANTVLDIPGFVEMLRTNTGLKKFHKLQWLKSSTKEALEEILENHNTSLEELVTMGSGQMVKLQHYTTLNRFGRQQVRDPSVPLETVVGFLCELSEDRKLDDLKKTNAYYGLLRDSIIGTWSMAAFEASDSDVFVSIRPSW